MLGPYSHAEHTLELKHLKGNWWLNHVLKSFNLSYTARAEPAALKPRRRKEVSARMGGRGRGGVSTGGQG